MSHSMYDKEKVYLAYRVLFSRDNAQLRKHKNIKKLVDQHRRGFEAFISSLGGVGNVVAILQPLLKAGVFSSETTARKTFPLLFRTSAEQDERHSMAEASTTRLEAEALVNVQKMDQIDQGQQGHQEHQEHQEHQDQPVNGVDDNHHTFDDSPERSATEPGNEPIFSSQSRKEIKLTLLEIVAVGGAEPVIKSLYPSYIPFRTQHLVLVSAQRLLEECCFDFTAKWAPSLIDRYGWDCPEAIELNKWTQIILKRVGKFPKDAFEYTYGSGIREVLTSVHVLRHSAVHRLHTSTKTINQMIHSAAVFAQALRDTDRQFQLEELHVEMENKVTAQELNKNFLEEKLARELDEIRERRKELDLREQEAINTLFREDNENKTLVGSMLEESVRGIFNLPGYSNEIAEKHDESTDEAAVDNSPNIGSQIDNNHNMVENSPQAERSVRSGGPFSPLPEEPVPEEPIAVEEIEPLAEPLPAEVPEEDVGTWPAPDQSATGETPIPTEEPQPAEEPAQIEEPIIEKEVPQTELIPEEEPTSFAEYAEEPVIEEEPAEVEKPMPDGSLPDQKPIEAGQWTSATNHVLDINGEPQADLEPEKTADPNTDAAGM